MPPRCYTCDLLEFTLLEDSSLPAGLAKCGSSLIGRLFVSLGNQTAKDSYNSIITISLLFQRPLKKRFALTQSIEALALAVSKFGLADITLKVTMRMCNKSSSDSLQVLIALEAIDSALF